MQHYDGDTIDSAIERLEFARVLFDGALGRGHMTTRQRYYYQQAILKTAAELVAIDRENTYESRGFAGEGG